MKPQIARVYVLLDTAYKIWSAVSQNYSQVGNDVQVNELWNKVHETKQGEMTIAQYFAKLSGLWQELDYYQDFQVICPEHMLSFRNC